MAPAGMRPRHSVLLALGICFASQPHSVGLSSGVCCASQLYQWPWLQLDCALLMLQVWHSLPSTGTS